MDEGLGFNFEDAWASTEVSERQEFTPVPKGKYVATVTKAMYTTPQPYNDGNTEIQPKPRVEWEYTIAEGQYEGRKLWDNSYISEKALPILKRNLQALEADEIKKLEQSINEYKNFGGSDKDILDMLKLVSDFFIKQGD